MQNRFTGAKTAFFISGKQATFCSLKRHFMILHWSIDRTTKGKNNNFGHLKETEEGIM